MDVRQYGNFLFFLFFKAARLEQMKEVFWHTTPPSLPRFLWSDLPLLVGEMVGFTQTVLTFDPRRFRSSNFVIFEALKSFSIQRE